MNYQRRHDDMGGAVLERALQLQQDIGTKSRLRPYVTNSTSAMAKLTPPTLEPDHSAIGGGKEQRNGGQSQHGRLGTRGAGVEVLLAVAQPASDAFTTSCKPARRAAKAISSAALPKVALSSPPMPSPVRAASSSVALPIQPTHSTIASAEARKTHRC
jgi:hypothetical protein